MEDAGLYLFTFATIPSASSFGVGFGYLNTFSQGIWSSKVYSYERIYVFRFQSTSEFICLVMDHLLNSHRASGCILGLSPKSAMVVAIGLSFHPTLKLLAVRSSGDGRGRFVGTESEWLGTIASNTHRWNMPK